MDLPLVVQVSRFDRWKDPEGVIRAFKLARKEVPCRLVLLGTTWRPTIRRAVGQVKQNTCHSPGSTV
jgi:glycosyltransferase involved in cell wall biosynthesis